MAAYLFSCSYATCTVPEAQKEIFKGSSEIVTSPKGWDPGALNLAQGFAMHYRTPLVHSEVTRLIIDVEQTGDAQWSKYSNKIPESSRARMSERIAGSFQNLLMSRIADDLQRHETCVHLMIHTHPGNPGSIQLDTHPTNIAGGSVADLWAQSLKSTDITVLSRDIEKPTPLARSLVSNHPPQNYAQIRLSVSQSFFLDSLPWCWTTLKKHLIGSLAPAVEKYEAG